ncbi:MAG: methionine ABC transporter ATP-binding protein [Acidaminococcaceae bacterium]|jgi:D-methionine transport system ATP-binding protein|nr:methionine ABC transporter ATP-binding protein [Acidaminococcaceae bacterium]
MIKLVNVEKTYYSKAGDIAALKKTNLDIKDGEIFGIIGLSGAGKSTLIRCINMLEVPTGGQVFVDGKELTAMNKQALRQARQSIGMIFQHFNLLASRTVRDNIAFPLEIQGKSKAEITKKVDELLDLVQLHDRADYYPSQLSGGQKQRVGIARALASDPKVLLSDEATSALDPQTTKSILALLRDINQRLHLTIVMITHQMEVVKQICDRVAVIENGNIIEEGTMYQVFTEPKETTTKEFVATVNDMTVPAILNTADMQQTYFDGSKVLVHLTFLGNADEPVVARLIKNYGVDVNIISGKIDYLKDMPYGTLLVEISGSKESLATALDYIHQAKVKEEVIGYVS